MPLSESEYDKFLVFACELLGIPIPNPDDSQIDLSCYDSRRDLDEPEDERVVELCLNIRTKS
jgi:hypothetical protein